METLKEFVSDVIGQITPTRIAVTVIGVAGVVYAKKYTSAEADKRLHDAEKEILALKKEINGRKLRSRRSVAEDVAQRKRPTLDFQTPRQDIELLLIQRLAGANNYLNEHRHGVESIGLNGAVGALPYTSYVSDGMNQAVLKKIDTDSTPQGRKATTAAYVKAGPRRELHFKPGNIRAAIVTCGGLCPGMNNVIQEVVRSIYSLYGCEIVLGIRGGYNGFYNSDEPPFALVPHQRDAYLYQQKKNPTCIMNGVTRNCQVVSVATIHHDGGTVIAAGRGGLSQDSTEELEKIVNFIRENRVQHLYVAGGDGTQRGANKIADRCIELKLDCVVVGIPKTIDNDIAVVDRSFGFETAVEAAANAVRAATVEAKCNKPRGIGIVRLMGRHAGFIAANATLAAGEVDLCLVPELPLVFEGENGCLAHLYRTVEEKGHAVVVVAEGAGLDHLEMLGEADGGGHKRLPPIGEYVKEKISTYFKAQKNPATIKYIDPSYMIRSVAANAADASLCIRLAQNAVHGAMAGMTKMIVGVVHNRIVYMPLEYVCDASPTKMNVMGSTWERVLCSTLQPLVRGDVVEDRDDMN